MLCWGVVGNSVMSTSCRGPAIEHERAKADEMWVPCRQPSLREQWSQNTA